MGQNNSKVLIEAVESNDRNALDLLRQEKFQLLLNTRVFHYDEGIRTVTPLYVACASGYTEFVNVAVQIESIDINIPRHSYTFNRSLIHTPIDVAIRNGYSDIVKILIENGAKFKTDKTGFNMIHCAVHHGRMEILEQILLLKFKSHINDQIYYREESVVRNKKFIKQNHGNTALHLAIKEDRTDIARMLIRSGACVDIKNADDKSPLSIARERNNQAIISYLQPTPSTSSFSHNRPQEILTEQFMNDLADNVGSDWRTIGTQLNISISRLDQLREDFLDTRTCITRMFLEWKRRSKGRDENHLIHDLRKALIKSGRRDLAERVTLARNGAHNAVQSSRNVEEISDRTNNGSIDIEQVHIVEGEGESSAPTILTNNETVNKRVAQIPKRVHFRRREN